MKSIKIDWFEIPVREMDRAIKFYERVFECKLDKHVMGDLQMAWFPEGENKEGANGTLVYQKQFYEPSNHAGVLIYLSSEDLELELNRVEEAGGEVKIPKRMISPEVGYMGVFIDSEGNRIALHSKK